MGSIIDYDSVEYSLRGTDATVIGYAGPPAGPPSDWDLVLPSNIVSGGDNIDTQRSHFYWRRSI